MTTQRRARTYGGAMYERSMSMMRRVAHVSGAIALAWVSSAGIAAEGSASRPCQQGERGRLVGYQKVGSYPTPDDTRAHFEEWIAFYQDYYQFPANLDVIFEYGFDSYK